MTIVVATRPTAWGTTLFCDDIRHEIQGTQSLIGIYNGQMLVGAEFPILLPKFSLMIKMFEDPEYRFKENGILRVFTPGEDQPVYETPINFLDRLESKSYFEAEAAVFEGLDKTIVASIPLMFSPFPVKQEGSIRVRLLVGETEYRLGALLVKKVANPLATASPPPPSRSPPAVPAS